MNSSLFVLQPLAGLVLAYTKAAAFSSGAYLGFSTVVCMNAFASGVFWRMKVGMIENLGVYFKQGVHGEFKANLHVRRIFSILADTSGWFFALDLLLIVVLASTTNDSIFHPTIRGNILNVRKGQLPSENSEPKSAYVDFRADNEKTSLMSHSNTRGNPFQDHDTEDATVSI
jgi:hypothetical protein